MGQTSFIRNAYGIPNNTKNLRQICDGRGFKTPADVEQFLSRMKVAVKTSEWKEKFLRYIYNKDTRNAKKFHDRLTVKASDDMDDYRENPDTFGVYTDNQVNDEDQPTIHEGGGGFVTFCDEMKKAFEFREELYSIIS